MDTAKVGRFGQSLAEALKPIHQVVASIVMQHLLDNFEMDINPESDDYDVLMCVVQSVCGGLGDAGTETLEAYVAKVSRSIVLAAEVIVPSAPNAVNIENAGYAKPAGPPQKSRVQRRKKASHAR